MTTSNQIVRGVGTAVTWVGLVTLFYVGFVLAQAASATNAAPDPIDPDTPLVAGQSLGHIRIERIGLRAAISEGERASVLKRGVGHLSDTPWIGEGGNVALAGHRDTVFRALRRIERGDVIEVATADATVRYKVEATAVVPPSDLSVLAPTRESTLTLITCYPFWFLGSAPDRFVVRAREITSQQ